MTHAVVRGEPTKAQIYLENIIEELVEETQRKEDRYCLNKILFKCLRDNPDEIRHIDATTGERETNKHLLERSIRTAIALRNSGVQIGDTVMLICKNHLESLALYFGAIFEGVIVYPLHYELTNVELKHFIGLQIPKIIFAEPDALELVDDTLKQNDINVKVVVFGKTKVNHENFSNYTSGFEESANKYWPVDLDRESCVMIYTTSGSTGLPKAAEIINKGAVAQLPSFWCYYKRFPNPTDLYFCPSGYSWITMSIATQICAVYRSTVLYTTSPLTAKHVRYILRTYKPTTAVAGGHLINIVLQEPGALFDDFHSLDAIYLVGSAISDRLIAQIKKNCHPNTLVHSSFGITEAHGCVAQASHDSPLGSVGKVLNVFNFKIVDAEGKEVGPNKPGELLLKSENCIFKSYVNNLQAYVSSFSEDGWFKTGDRVYMDENEEVFFLDRIKFLIKYQNHHISPGELEAVISDIEGISKAAVVDSERGPAAMVVCLAGSSVNPQTIHDTVKAVLSDRKRLRGGIAFVESLPVNTNFKLDRKQSKEQFDKINKQSIYYDNAA